MAIDDEDAHRLSPEGLVAVVSFEVGGLSTTSEVAGFIFGLSNRRFP